MTPLPRVSPQTVGPLAKRAQEWAKKAGPVVTPFVMDTVRPMMTDPERRRRATARLTPSGRLAADIDGAVELTREMSAQADADPSLADLNARALRLQSRYRNAVNSGGSRKALLDDVRTDLAALHTDIDSALR